MNNLTGVPFSLNLFGTLTILASAPSMDLEESHLSQFYRSYETPLATLLRIEESGLFGGPV